MLLKFTRRTKLRFLYTGVALGGSGGPTECGSVECY